MLNNPAKSSYLKFDALAKTMQTNPTSPTKDKGNGVKGLLKDLNKNLKTMKKAVKNKSLWR